MTSRTFLDTNVLVYAVDAAEPRKQGRARAILAAGATEDVVFVVSTQVLAEFYVTVVRKLDEPMSEDDAADRVRELSAFPVVQTDVDLVHTAIATSRREQLSLWDALILEAARRAGCDRLLSEDLQHGRVHGGRLTIENPFRDVVDA